MRARKAHCSVSADAVTRSKSIGSKIHDLGVRTRIARTVEQPLVRVKENPGPGQYIVDEEIGLYTICCLKVQKFRLQYKLPGDGGIFEEMA